MPETQTLINNALSVRLRSAEVLNVFIDVEPVNFNKGYYSCDLTFFFLLSFDLYTSPSACPQVINGIATFNKKVILYGSCGSVKTFSNVVGEECRNHNTNTFSGSNTPKCVVSAVDPVPLSARIGTVRDCYEASCCIPDCVCEALGGHVVTDIPRGTPTIYATIGLFTVVQLIRNVQMLIPVYDFCVPQKSCDHSTAEPCDTFSRIQFPLDDFFPPRPDSVDNGSDCGCAALTDD
ncbi:MAG: hypothetical protein J6C27_01315 [Clostridia bacterium]|nr:hypothetical protein [Clostridia bacterium]